MRSAASLQRWDTGLIPSLAQWVKDPALLQQWLRYDPRPEIYISHRAAKKEKKKKFPFHTQNSPVWSSLTAQQLKDLVLSLLWLRLLLW